MFGLDLSWIVLTIVNVPVYLILGRLFFNDWQGFWECVRFWITPDIVSLFRGNYFDDHWAELKLFVYLALCCGAVYSEHRLFFGPWFPESST